MLNYNVLNRYVELLKKNRMAVVSTTDNIKELSTADINKLKAGDIVLKKDSTGKHAYIVSYKKDGTGICLTYVDASVAETVSYDYNSGTKEWVYNSTDITPLEGAQYTAGDNITISGNVISATDTTYTAGDGISISEQNVISTSNHLYKHFIKFNETTGGNLVNINIEILCSKSDAFTTIATINNYIKNKAVKNFTCTGTFNDGNNNYMLAYVNFAGGLYSNEASYYLISGDGSYQARSLNNATTVTDSVEQLL